MSLVHFVYVEIKQGKVSIRYLGIMHIYFLRFAKPQSIMTVALDQIKFPNFEVGFKPTAYSTVLKDEIDNNPLPAFLRSGLNLRTISC